MARQKAASKPRAGTSPANLEREEVEAERLAAQRAEAEREEKAELVRLEEQARYREFQIALAAVNRMPETHSGVDAGRWLGEFVRNYRRAVAEPDTITVQFYPAGPASMAESQRAEQQAAESDKLPEIETTPKSADE